MKSFLIKTVPVCIAGLIIYLLYSKIDFDAFTILLKDLNYPLLILAVFLFIPIMAVATLRFCVITKPFANVSFFQSFRYIASSNSLNIIIPSKLGCFTKAYFLKEFHAMDLKKSFATVFYERLMDLACMGMIFLVANILSAKWNPLIVTASIAVSAYLIIFLTIHIVRLPAEIKNVPFHKFINKILDSTILIRHYKAVPKSKMILLKLNAISMILWLMHSFQLVLFFKTINVKFDIPFQLSCMYCSVFIGLLPISIGGIGTRDWAIITLMQDLISYQQSIVLGLLMTLRLIVPVFLGLPFLNHTFVSIIRKKKDGSGNNRNAGSLKG